jgi:hypothetical protein
MALLGSSRPEAPRIRQIMGYHDRISHDQHKETPWVPEPANATAIAYTRTLFPSVNVLCIDNARA